MDNKKRWGERRYYSLDYELKNTFGEKVYKITLNGGMTCPNRDGRCGTGGCIFCSAKGSGDFAGSAALPIEAQLARGKRIWRRNALSAPTLPISRRLPTPTLLWIIWKIFFPGPSGIRM